eukprot:CFRG7352T1
MISDRYVVPKPRPKERPEGFSLDVIAPRKTDQPNGNNYITPQMHSRAPSSNVHSKLGLHPTNSLDEMPLHRASTASTYGNPGLFMPTNGLSKDLMPGQTPRQRAQLATAKKFKDVYANIANVNRKLESIDSKSRQEQSMVFHEKVTPRRPRSSRKLKFRGSQSRPTNNYQRSSPQHVSEGRPAITKCASGYASKTKRAVWGLVYITYGVATMYVIAYLVVLAIVQLSLPAGGPPT